MQNYSSAGNRFLCELWGKHSGKMEKSSKGKWPRNVYICAYDIRCMLPIRTGQLKFLNT